MKAAPVVLAVAASIALALAAAHARAAEPAPAKVDVKAVLDRFDDLWRGRSSKAQITMQIKTKHWERSLTMQAWSLGKDRSLVRVLKPLKERGIATLKVGREVYNYLPDTDRTIKITSGMMMGAWMGSHFTNDDLVKESRMADDYATTLSFFGARDGQPVIELTSVPKPAAAVVWGKVVTTVRTADWQPLTILFYDDDGKLARTISYSAVRQLGDRALPTVMRVTPADRPGEYTEVIYDDIAFGVDLDEAFFSLNQLKR